MKIRDNSERFARSVTGILAAERVSQKLSHEVLAKSAGIHRSTVSRIESGLMRPTLEVVHAMATALSLDFADVVSRAQGEEKL